MDVNQFIKNFADQFEDTDSAVFSLDTKFRDLSEWSSLVHLSIILMLDKEYDVAIDEDAFRKLITIGDIFEFINK